jgi:hypothetical protein
MNDCNCHTLSWGRLGTWDEQVFPVLTALWPGADVGIIKGDVKRSALVVQGTEGTILLGFKRAVAPGWGLRAVGFQAAASWGSEARQRSDIRAAGGRDWSGWSMGLWPGGYVVTCPPQGVITVKGLVDREKGDFHTLTVVADDGGPKVDATVVSGASESPHMTAAPDTSQPQPEHGLGKGRAGGDGPGITPWPVIAIHTLTHSHTLHSHSTHSLSHSHSPGRLLGGWHPGHTDPAGSGAGSAQPLTICICLSLPAFSCSCCIQKVSSCRLRSPKLAYSVWPCTSPSPEEMSHRMGLQQASCSNPSQLPQST